MKKDSYSTKLQEPEESALDCFQALTCEQGKISPDATPGQEDILVVIMAGGLGSRLGELTKDRPKPMLSVGGKPILETIVCNLKNEGFRKFIFTVNYRSEQIIEYFGNGEQLGVNIQYVKEYKRMGTAGSLSLLQERVNGPMVVMNGDILTKTNLKEMLYFHLTTNSDATMCVQNMEFVVPFGVVDVDDTQVININEKPTERKMLNAGMYILNGNLVKMIPEDTFYDMTTLLQTLLDKHKVSAFPISDYWIDIGREQDFYKANLDYDVLFNI